MTENEKAVIIGCYLNGAKPALIAQRMMLFIEDVQKVIEEYEKRTGTQIKKQTQNAPAGE